MLAEGVVEAPMDIDLCLILGAGWPFHLGGITPYLDRRASPSGCSAAGFLPPGVASVPTNADSARIPVESALDGCSRGFVRRAIGLDGVAGDLLRRQPDLGQQLGPAAVGRNACGMPNSRNGVSTSANRSSWASRAPQPPTTPLSSMVTTSSCSPARRTSAGLTGSAQTGSTTVTPMPWSASRSPTATPVPASGPEPTTSTRGCSVRSSTSSPSTWSTAARSAGTWSLEKRSTAARRRSAASGPGLPAAASRPEGRPGAGPAPAG